jgi:hypothetical protein
MLALLIPGLGMGAGTAPVLVEVPDVVGETQAAGTTTLEGEGFVVSVSTAFSASVAAGLIISQDPEGGELAASGSTVAIVVSLGLDEQPSGGWMFLRTYESETRRRREELRKRQELEEETDRIENDLDRSIAQLLREQEAIDAKRADLDRLAEIAKQNADLEAARRYSARVAEALAEALTAENYKALSNLDRELRKAREEEEALMFSMMLLLDE